MDHKYSIVKMEGKSHLDIADLTEEDYGTYVCHVMNLRGEIGFPIELAKIGNILLKNKFWECLMFLTK